VRGARPSTTPTSNFNWPRGAEEKIVGHLFDVGNSHTARGESFTKPKDRGCRDCSRSRGPRRILTHSEEGPLDEGRHSETPRGTFCVYKVETPRRRRPLCRLSLGRANSTSWGLDKNGKTDGTASSGTRSSFSTRKSNSGGRKKKIPIKVKPGWKTDGRGLPRHGAFSLTRAGGDARDRARVGGVGLMYQKNKCHPRDPANGAERKRNGGRCFYCQ